MYRNGNLYNLRGEIFLKTGEVSIGNTHASPVTMPVFSVKGGSTSSHDENKNSAAEATNRSGSNFLFIG
jgi:hypothetical protein